MRTHKNIKENRDNIDRAKQLVNSYVILNQDDKDFVDNIFDEINRLDNLILELEDFFKGIELIQKRKALKVVLKP